METTKLKNLYLSTDMMDASLISSYVEDKLANNIGSEWLSAGYLLSSNVLDIENATVYGLYNDENNYIVGTKKNGLYVIEKNTLSFTKCTLNSESLQELEFFNTGRFKSIIKANGKYVALNAKNYNYLLNVYASDDGYKWNLVKLADIPGAPLYAAATSNLQYINGKYLFVIGNLIMYSADLVTWNTYTCQDQIRFVYTCKDINNENKVFCFSGALDKICRVYSVDMPSGVFTKINQFENTFTGKEDFWPQCSITSNGYYTIAFEIDAAKSILMKTTDFQNVEFSTIIDFIPRGISALKGIMFITCYGGLLLTSTDSLHAAIFDSSNTSGSEVIFVENDKVCQVLNRTDKKTLLDFYDIMSNELLNHEIASVYKNIKLSINNTVNPVKDEVALLKENMNKVILNFDGNIVTFEDNSIEVDKFSEVFYDRSYDFNGKKYNKSVIDIKLVNTYNTLSANSLSGQTKLSSFTANKLINVLSNALYLTINLKELNIDYLDLSSIGALAFKESGITRISSDNNVKIDYYAFRWCKNLSSLSFKNAEIIVDSYTADSCKNLEYVNFSNALRLGSNVFIGCSKLTVIDFSDRKTNTVPPLANINAFSGLPENYVIKVPNNLELYNAWCNAEQWNLISTHIQMA